MSNNENDMNDNLTDIDEEDEEIESEHPTTPNNTTTLMEINQNNEMEIENSTDDENNGVSNNDEFDEFDELIDDEIIENFVGNVLRNVIRAGTFSQALTTMERQYSFNFDYLFETDPIDVVLRESLANQQTLEKTDKEIHVLTQRYKSIHNLYDENTCRICLTEFEAENIISKMDSCKHIFHIECLVEWARYKNNCPVCRKIIEDNDMGDID